MCGLGGFLNVHPSKREALVRALGEGIDTRGGDAAGYVAIEHDAREVNYSRKGGQWTDEIHTPKGMRSYVVPGASDRFVAGACGDVVILHARYATCGNSSDPSQAHPFAIKRADADAGGALRSYLWGAHNGVLSGTKETAKAHGRAHDVDSRELFELLADGHLETIRSLRGWGTLAWIERTARDCVYLVRMTKDACLEAVTTTCGALVYASTWKILDAALRAAGLQVETRYEIETGKVYAACADGILRYTSRPDITLNEYPKQEYYADRWDSAGWKGASFAGADDSSGSAVDDFWAPPCPSCGSLDTWEYDDWGTCEDCSYRWALPEPPADEPSEDTIDADAAEDEPSGNSWIEWSEYLRKRADRERREREALEESRVYGRPLRAGGSHDTH